jgi:hypothetical protein
MPSQQLFRFCQLDFSFLLGPADGRYLVRGDENDALDVVVFRTLGAPPRARMRRRPRRVESGASDPEPVPLSRVTVIGAIGFDTEDEARAWLERCRTNEEEREQAVGTALRVLNRALHAHRVSAADPYLCDVSAARAQTGRLGYGIGDEVVEGRWRAAYTLPPARGGRRGRQMLAPEEQMAGILSGKRPTWASEDLVLRTRLDLEQGRIAQAVLQLGAALAALEAELARDGDQGDEAAQLRQRQATLSEIAAAGLPRPAEAARVEALEQALAETERAIRRRRHRAG